MITLLCGSIQSLVSPLFVPPDLALPAPSLPVLPAFAPQVEAIQCLILTLCSELRGVPWAGVHLWGVMPELGFACCNSLRCSLAVWQFLVRCWLAVLPRPILHSPIGLAAHTGVDMYSWCVVVVGLFDV